MGKEDDSNFADSWHTGLTPVTKPNNSLNKEIGRRWLEQAEGEHASVASFARNTLQLLTLGSPSELLIASKQAGIDEINHAKISYDIASANTGLRLAPGPLDIQESMKKLDVMSVVRSIIREGCVGETIAGVDPNEDMSIQKHGFLTPENVKKAREVGIRDIILPAYQNGFENVDLISKNMKNLDLNQF